MISGSKMALTRKEVERASEMFSNTVRLQTPWWNIPESALSKNLKKITLVQWLNEQKFTNSSNQQ